MAELLTICHRDNLVQESGPSSVGNDTEKVKKANARDKVLLRMPVIKNIAEYRDYYYKSFLTGQDWTPEFPERFGPDVMSGRALA